MKDTVLLDVKRMIDSYSTKDDKEAMRIICNSLVRFSYDKGLLLKSPFNEQGELNSETIIRERGLTEKGKSIFDDLAEKWFAYTDRTDKIDNVSMLEKWYSKMVNV
jgi:hypothetical protein